MTEAADVRMLDGFGVTGYRSIYGDLKTLGPLSKVNLLAGQNNSGKSNFLRFAHDYLSDSLGGQNSVGAPVPSGLDQPRGIVDADVYRFAVAVRVTDDDIAALLRRGTGRQVLDAVGESHLTRTFIPFFRDGELRLTGDDLVWITMMVSRQAHMARPVIAEELVRNLNNSHPQLSAVMSQIGFRSGNSSSGPVENLLSDLVPAARSIRLIAAFRRIQGPHTPSPVQIDTRLVERERLQAEHSGAGLVQSLLRLQTPPREEDEDNRARFAQINTFVAQVLDDPTARLEIPFDAATANVRRRGLLLPLESLGTGVHQVIILAAAATVITDSLVCMEEPELHLHPLLQRKLIRYLRDHTSNQYLIATHSAHLLDHEAANVFHVQHTDNGTEIQRAGSPQQLADLCADLGYRPSDLLQANAVIWVEGPSDRIYLRKWISLVDNGLVEGIHFSIMFYGGRLLNHLTAYDPEIEDFISLRRLNRHIAILIDSDKTSAQKPVGETKKRVVKGFNDDSYPGFAWVTKCRTIENYVPHAHLARAMADVHRATLTYTGGPWADPLTARPTKRRRAPLRPDKVKIAQHVALHLTTEDLNHRDLRARIRQIVAFIHAANGSIDGPPWSARGASDE